MKGLSIFNQLFKGYGSFVCRYDGKDDKDRGVVTYLQGDSRPMNYKASPGWRQIERYLEGHEGEWFQFTCKVLPSANHVGVYDPTYIVDWFGDDEQAASAANSLTMSHVTRGIWNPNEARATSVERCSRTVKRLRGEIEAPIKQEPARELVEY